MLHTTMTLKIILAVAAVVSLLIAVQRYRAGLDARR
jgi:hypothetical protein